MKTSAQIFPAGRICALFVTGNATSVLRIRRCSEMNSPIRGPKNSSIEPISFVKQSVSVNDWRKGSNFDSYLTGSQNQNIPIIAMTAYAMDGDKEKFLAERMNAYIAKPVDIEQLEALLQHVLGGDDYA